MTAPLLEKKMNLSDKAELALRIVDESPLIAYDTETSGVIWRKNYPVGYVVTNDEVSVYVPVRAGGGGNLPDPNVRPLEGSEMEEPLQIHKFEIELAKKFQERSQKSSFLSVGHNMKFDCHASATANIFLGRNITCTQNRETLIDENSRGFSLEESANRRKVTAKKSQVMYDHLATQFGVKNNKNSMSEFWRLAGDDEIGVDYAEGDGVSTLELYKVQQTIIEQQDLQVVDKLEAELIWTLFRMERRGIKLDMDYLETLRKEIRAEAEELSAQLPFGLNLRSGKQMLEYIEGQLGRTDYPKTDLGNPSFPEKYLKTFEEGQHIVKVRKWMNLDNSFLTPLIEEHSFKGRVHANLNQLRTDESGTAARLSCSFPNLQQVPKHEKELAKRFRKAFIADEGYEFYEADYSQCEPRLFGHYSKAPSLVEGYTATPSRDMHQIVADMMNVDRDFTAKRMNMGILTGMGVNAFAGHMGWDVQTAGTKHREWFNVFPEIKQFQYDAKAVILQRGYVMTLLKRRGRLDNRRFAYKAVSKIIQGSNADILKWKMVELDKMVEDTGDLVHFLMTVHDAFEWQAPATDEGRKLSTEIMRIMEDVQGEPFNLRLPFAVDFDRGSNWAEATFGVGNV